jgi:hypothetical protein
MIDDLDLQGITDEKARQNIQILLNRIEQLTAELREGKEEIQRLRDEVNRLKGEQGKPKIPPGKSGRNHSSEQERKKGKPRRRRRKKNDIKVDREEKLAVEKSELPEDAVFKGYEEVVVQDLKIETDNVRFLKEKYYSPARRKTYLASLPAGYQGEYGPGVRSLVLTLYYGAEMTEPKIHEFFENMGVSISKGQISNMLIKDQDEWHEEKEEIYLSGLQSSTWQHIDDTTTRVNGKNQYCHVVCNPWYSAYFTRPRKDRLTVIDILSGPSGLRFLLNEQTAKWLKIFKTPQSAQRVIEQWPHNEELTYLELNHLIQTHVGHLNDQQQARVYEAASLTAYYNQTTTPAIDILISDDAHQFRNSTNEQGLCWVHEGRHYKKLIPAVADHQQLVDDFLVRFWAYYHKLQAYALQPSENQAVFLESEFEAIFSTTTGYDQLDKKIAQTLSKKDRLLTVLQFPQIPLHNNPAELAARRRVRKRDVSFGPRSPDGVAAWDTFATLAATARKLGVSFYAYIFDRVAEIHALPRLAETILARSLCHSLLSSIS